MSSKDLKRSQMTSIDLAEPEAIVKITSNKRNKIFLQAGSMHENIEISNECFDESLHNSNF